MSQQSELTPEQLLQQKSLPGRPITVQETLAAVGTLRGRVVVVTGAGSGFGRAFSLLAAGHGAKVVASDVNLGTVQSLVKEIKQEGGQAVSTLCNTADWDSQVAMFKLAVSTYGVIDVVIANAGITERPGFFDDNLDSRGNLKKPDMATVNINLLGAMYTARLAFYHLNQNRRKGKKSLVMIGSMSSFFGIPLAPAYSMSKHAILGLFRSLYFSGLAMNINLNIVCPWFCETGIITGPTALAIAGLPLATVENVVLGILRAASDDSVNGEIMSVDAAGIMSIPYDAFILGEDGGYYQAFALRASGAISAITTIKDVVRAVKPTGVARSIIKLGGLIALLAKLYRNGGLPALKALTRAQQVRRAAVAVGLLVI